MDFASLLTWLLSLLLGLTNATTSLNSVRQVADHPLYVMTYHGDYARTTAAVETIFVPLARAYPETAPTYACSLFVSYGDPANPLYGRNFDWNFSPAVLVFSDPPEGYASVSLVDISFLGYSDAEARRLLDLPLADRAALLNAPLIPLDGLNEHGLTIAVAAVPGSARPYDPSLPTAGSLEIVRLMLDHARTVDEALAILRGHNIDFTGGPSIHYLIADAEGHAALAEIYEGALVVSPGGPDWAIATNFYMASVPANRSPGDHHYNVLRRALESEGLTLEPATALAMLSEVAQASTQWSVVYGLRNGEVHIALDRDYATVHTFALPMASE